MKNRVHYGEFTLDYWVEQIISGNIELPEYQRSFVWNTDQIKSLINSIGKDLYVPPITIGKLGNKNIIIDGQQRLTSIVLAYFNIVPTERKFRRTVKVPGETADDEIEEEHYFEWTVKLLQDLGHNIATVKENLIANNDYEPLGIHWVNDEFLKKHYLGFSYIIPNEASTEEQRHTFFSTIFRNVNISGTPLLKAESRKSLYYLKPIFVPFFDPEFAKTILVKQFNNDPQPLDFLRQLALVFDYAKNNDSKQVMKGYKSKSEQYYELFMSDMVNQDIDAEKSRFKKLEDVMPLNKIGETMKFLKDEVAKLDIPKEYSSIIEVDLFMIGLIYWTLIRHKHMKGEEESIANLKTAINNKIREYKEDPSHSRSPSTLKYLRSRIQSSIDIYQRFTV